MTASTPWCDQAVHEPSSHPPRLPRLLVVDDSPDSLWLMSRLFEERFDVLAAASGRDALALAACEPAPDLVLLDIVMPDMDGYEVLRRLRQDPRTAGIPVAFVSALGESAERRLGLELGAIDYLTKPIDPQEVVRRVDAHTREAARQRKLNTLGERLARHLSAQAWHQLFNGAGAATIAFESCELTLLVVDAAALQASPAERDAFIEELDAQALAHGGSVDHYARGPMVLFFDEPRDALRAALGLQRDAGGRRIQLGLHHGACDVARFRGLGAWERTLLGDEAALARRATAGGQPGFIVLSPKAYGPLRDDIHDHAGHAVLTEKFQGTGLSKAWLAPIEPTGWPGAARQQEATPGCAA